MINTRHILTLLLI